MAASQEQDGVVMHERSSSWPRAWVSNEGCLPSGSAPGWVAYNFANGALCNHTANYALSQLHAGMSRSLD